MHQRNQISVPAKGKEMILRRVTGFQGERMKRSLVGAFLSGALVVAFGLVAPDSARAFSCSVIGQSNGNPSGENVYGCTGLVEGDSLSFSVNQTVNTDTLTATVDITVFDVANGSVKLDIDISNSSSGGGQTNRITVFGLGIDPNQTGGSISDLGGVSDVDALTGFDTGNFPGFSLVEFCATSGPNCAGGGGGGIQSGQEDKFRFTLTGGYTAGGTIDLSQFAFKFQGGVESYEKPGSPECCTSVPEPTSVALLGTGLLGLALVTGGRALRRRS
jgi:hypothetical protein